MRRLRYAIRQYVQHRRAGRRGRGAGTCDFCAGLGIGKLAASAVESMARQPEVAGQIHTAMIIAAGAD